MAKVTGPLFSVTARGQIGKALIYSRWRGIDYVKQYAIPHQPNTPAQLAVRDKIRNLARTWSQKMPETYYAGLCHDFWIDQAWHFARPLTGYNLWIQTYFPVDPAERIAVFCAYTQDMDEPEGQATMLLQLEQPTTVTIRSLETGAEIEETVDSPDAHKEIYLPLDDFPIRTLIAITPQAAHPITIITCVHDIDGEC